MAKYMHGIYPNTADTEMSEVVTTSTAQVVIGTAPVHLLDNPADAVNKPILCESMADCRSKLGYSENFKKYTLCQAMYACFMLYSVAPVVFINVLDPEKHFTEVTEQTCQINDNSIVIEDDVIVSTLEIKVSEETVDKEKYDASWADGKLVINFTEAKEGTAQVSYHKADPEKVTKDDIIGKLDTATGKRSGAELIKSIFPRLGAVPFIITAPGWTTDDTVTAVLKEKAPSINGCYKAMVIADIDTKKAKTITAAIEEKESRTLDENCIAVYPMVKKGDMILSYSAVLSALIMYQSTTTGGITCQSPSNKPIDIDDVVLADGTSIFYDQDDGNELNAAGIVTVVSRNGWYAWGNNTAAYPKVTDPVKRWIMTRLTFLWIENDFVNTNIGAIDGPIERKAVEAAITDENIKLASYASQGYIAAGKISYNAADNPASEILKGHFKFRTRIAANIPTEYIENEFSFDTEALRNAILGEGSE